MNPSCSQQSRVGHSPFLNGQNTIPLSSADIRQATATLSQEKFFSLGTKTRTKRSSSVRALAGKSSSYVSYVNTYSAVSLRLRSLFSNIYDVIHVTSRTRPSRFSACNIESWVGPGDEAKPPIHACFNVSHVSMH